MTKFVTLGDYGTYSPLLVEGANLSPPENKGQRMAKKTKRVRGIGVVTHSGSCCVGNMSWETPFIQLRTETHGIIVWQSDQADAYGYLTYECKFNGVKVEYDLSVRADGPDFRVWRMHTIQEVRANE